MTNIRYDHTEIKRTGARKALTEEMLRVLIMEAEALINNDVDSIHITRSGSALRFIGQRTARNTLVKK